MNEILSTLEAAAYLRCTPRTLFNWRIGQTAPPHYDVNGRVRYRRSEIDAWLAARRVE